MTGRYPRQFGKYVLLKPLAKGGMGEIYLAAGGDVGGFEKLCVIKKVITEKADKAKANRFLDEAKVVLRLSHSALVTTFDAGDVGGEFYIAMELVEGKDLREVWNRCVRTRQRIPLDVALHLVREVARALAYVHSYGDLKLVHRDVAPPNILLAYVGDVKLTDFGLARSVLKQEHTAPGVVFGRAAYLAPEQARGEVADARTDVYTLGIVLWELLTGQQFLQLSGLDPAAALAIVRHPKFAPPSVRAPWISPALDSVVTRALEADRNQRFASAEDFRVALSDVISDVAPRADSGRVAEFLRGIYAETIEEERTEREHFLRETIPQFRANPPPLEAEPAEVSVPVTAVPVRPRALTRPGGMGPPDNSKTDVDPDTVMPATPPPDPARATRPSQPVRLPGLPGLPPSVDGAPGNGVRPRLPVPPLPLRALEPRAAARPPDLPATPNVTLVPDPEGARTPSPPPIPEVHSSSSRIVAGHRLVRPLFEGRLGSLHLSIRVGTTAEGTVRLLDVAQPLSPMLIDRARDESARLVRLAHPNIAAATDVGFEEGRLYAVMPPIGSGTDLASVLRSERRIEAGRALEITLQICRALGAAHGVGVLHLQLEPERILTIESPSLKIKVLDFGLAGLSGEGALLTGDVASVPYRAPELLVGAPADARADVYAVGAILYELVTGSPPHAGSLDPAGRKLIEPVQSPRMFRPEIPVALERLLLSALEREPSARPASIAAFEEALTAIARAREASAGPESPTRVTPGTAQERRRQRREAAFQVIGDLMTTTPRTASTDLPPPFVTDPSYGLSSDERATPLVRPPAAVVASAMSAPPSSPQAGFGGAMLSRYGAADDDEKSARKKRNIIMAAAAIALALILAFVLSR